MEEIYFTETTVDHQRITRCYVPEDSIVHNHSSDNLKSYAYSLINYFVDGY
jgi:hypothetical protein